jgi:hypothetical protein
LARGGPLRPRSAHRASPRRTAHRRLTRPLKVELTSRWGSHRLSRWTKHRACPRASCRLRLAWGVAGAR